MKIDSMDAVVNFPIPRNVHDSKAALKQNEISADKSINQMSNLEKQELPVSEKIIISAIEKANKEISGSNRHLEYSIHEKTKEIMVKVVDTDTNEVVREFPPEKILDMIAKMWEMAGLIVDERR